MQAALYLVALLSLSSLEAILSAPAASGGKFSSTYCMYGAYLVIVQSLRITAALMFKLIILWYSIVKPLPTFHLFSYV